MTSLEGETVTITGNLWENMGLDHVMGKSILKNKQVKVIKDNKNEVVFKPKDTENLPTFMKKLKIGKLAVRYSDYDSPQEIFRESISL